MSLQLHGIFQNSFFEVKYKIVHTEISQDLSTNVYLRQRFFHCPDEIFWNKCLPFDLPSSNWTIMSSCSLFSHESFPESRLKMSHIYGCSINIILKTKFELWLMSFEFDWQISVLFLLFTEWNFRSLATAV